MKTKIDLFKGFFFTRNHFAIVILLVLSPTVAFSLGPPQAITDIVATSGNGEIELTWTAPFDNGSTIKSYTVIMWRTGTDSFTTFPNLGVVTQATVPGLQNGVSYSFKVIAINDQGQGPDSVIISAIPTVTPSPFVPDKITTLSAKRDDGKVTLSWNPPFDNGAKITSYKIFYWDLGTSNTKVKTLEAKATSSQITDLKNDVAYSFKIVAMNSLGHGPDSNIVSATPSKSTIASIPNKVRAVTATGSNERVFISWVQPSANGSPITSYKILVSETGSQVFNTHPNLGIQTNAIITGLKNGVSYTFRVIAINAVGEGKPSDPATAIPSKTAPIEISNLKAASGNGKAHLSWSVPQGVSQVVTSYRVREYVVGKDSFIVHNLLDKSTKATISGLQNGVSYGFSVQAVTQSGVGPLSKIVNVTPKAPSPAGAPNQIKDLKVIAGDQNVRLSWTPPGDNGSPITGYNIQQFKQGENYFTTIPKDAKNTSVIVSGLTNDQSYDFKVVAINSVGPSPESNLVSATPGSLESKITIPPWIKNNAKWWAEGQISDLEYVRAIEYLINQGIIKIKN